MTAPPWLRARHRTCLLSLVLLNVFTLFVVTVLKPIVSVSADFLFFVCPNPDMLTFVIFAISVSQCFAKFASLANTTFARSQMQVSQFYVRFARFARF